jgi:hypothetical protein
MLLSVCIFNQSTIIIVKLTMYMTTEINVDLKHLLLLSFHYTYDEVNFVFVVFNNIEFDIN